MFQGWSSGHLPFSYPWREMRKNFISCTPMEPVRGALDQILAGTCHRGYKSIPIIPYTKLSRKYTRLYTNFPKMYTWPHTNFSKEYTRPYTLCKNLENRYPSIYQNYENWYRSLYQYLELIPFPMARPCTQNICNAPPGKGNVMKLAGNWRVTCWVVQSQLHR